MSSARAATAPGSDTAALMLEAAKVSQQVASHTRRRPLDQGMTAIPSGLFPSIIIINQQALWKTVEIMKICIVPCELWVTLLPAVHCITTLFGKRKALLWRDFVVIIDVRDIHG